MSLLVISCGGYHSVPIKYIGEEVEIRLTTAFIHIYYNGELIQTHPISEKK